MPDSIPPDEALARALGDTLTQMLDRRAALILDLLALDKAIDEERVNRLQSQIGAPARMLTGERP